MTELPLVPVEYVLAGKLLALGQSVAIHDETRDPVDYTRIRHAVDLYACQSQLASARTRAGVLDAMHAMQNPPDWSLLTRAAHMLAAGDLYSPDAYADYVATMFPEAEQDEYLSAAALVYDHIANVIGRLQDMDASRPEPGPTREL